MDELDTTTHKVRRGGGGPDNDTVLGWFEFHAATEVTGPIHASIRNEFKVLARFLLLTLPDGPDRTLALRELQRAMMSANACIANAQADGPPINSRSVP